MLSWIPILCAKAEKVCRLQAAARDFSGPFLVGFASNLGEFIILETTRSHRFRKVFFRFSYLRGKRLLTGLVGSRSSSRGSSSGP